MERAGIDIFDARIIESNNKYSLDTFFVLRRNKELLDDKLASKMTALLESNIASRVTTKTRLSTHALPRQTKQFRLNTAVTFDDVPEKHYSIMLVTAFDRPGLLSRIAETLSRYDIYILTAKIATYGERAEDIFMISDREGEIITKELKETLTAEIIANIDSMFAESA